MYFYLFLYIFLVTSTPKVSNLTHKKNGNQPAHLLKHSHLISINYSILLSQNILYHLYYIILQYFQYPNFYFPILLIKIIFLHNKIIYSPITIIYNTTHYLFFLSHSFCSTINTNFTKTTIITCPPLLHYAQLTPSTPPSPHHIQTWQTQTKPTTNPQPNADLHNTPKRRSPMPIRTHATHDNPNKPHHKPIAQC